MSSRLQTQQRLVEAARSVIVEYGIEGCTQQRICKQAGLTRGAFYSNYAAKEDLFTHVAQDAYQRIISRLDQVVASWSGEDSVAVGEADAGARICMFLSRAQVELGLTRELFILHNELLSRAARVPEWALQFREINRKFVLRVSQVLELIVNQVGRTLNRSPEAITHAVLGIALRSAGISAWKIEVYPHNHAIKHTNGILDDEDAVDMILTLLIACSEPLPK
ncbi:TetR/AcrR family transcriptional regulator [Corynebacterium sp.]|uniref:TetR/AcrR family transcriptional regulator n=1 Tax=Corynebacterium sp. TaxID=1720 RepID=UPI0026DC6E35|nr:TetR/AcrR family transcriptional regulator [Corynebacterium sp.]MDO5077810.1 TetR/AcrR family transcriptional regulator [Corynebacterium sp.]